MYNMVPWAVEFSIWVLNLVRPKQTFEGGQKNWKIGLRSYVEGPLLKGGIQ